MPLEEPVTMATLSVRSNRDMWIPSFVVMIGGSCGQRVYFLRRRHAAQNPKRSSPNAGYGIPRRQYWHSRRFRLVPARQFPEKYTPSETRCRQNTSPSSVRRNAPCLYSRATTRHRASEFRGPSSPIRRALRAHSPVVPNASTGSSNLPADHPTSTAPSPTRRLSDRRFLNHQVVDPVVPVDDRSPRLFGNALR